ncbi:MAG TPA: tetratricopeptide repeat protein [Thermoanaerobaculia bacterium]|nr:tetratricopeptide repeat protein [Thermoanaerobaculia bacterium]
MRVARALAFAGVAAIFFLAVAAELPAQDWRGKARVDGWVKDKSGKPVAGATVTLARPKGGGTSIQANDKGYWAILGLANGPWNIDVSAKGFETRKVTVQLSEGTRIPPMEILLEPAAAPAAGAAAPNQAAAEMKAAVEEGNRLLTEKKYAEARAQYEKALTAIPDNAALLKGIAQTYHGENNRAKAIETLRKVQQLDPGDNDNRMLLASMLLEDGKLDEGQQLLEGLPPGSVKDPAVYTNVGILFMNKNNPTQAQAYFTKAIELDATQADAYYYRGLSYLGAKKTAEAKTDFKKYLELKPQGEEAKEVREILQTLK